MKRSKLKTVFYISFFVLLFAALGYFRDLVFRYTNAQINLLEYGGEPFPFYPGLKFLGILTLKQLYLFKWALTVFVFLLHWLIAFFIIRIWFRKKENFRLLHFSYLACILLGAIGFLLGKLFSSDHGYYFARWIMGAAQSPIIIMIVLAALIGFEKITNQKSQSHVD